jgi:subtilisin family serine protease
MSTPCASQRPRRRRAGALAGLTILASTLLFASSAAAAAPPRPPPGPFVSPSAALDPGHLSAPLAARLAESDGSLPVIVTLRADVPSGAYAGQPERLLRALRHRARRRLPPLMTLPGRRVRRLWLVNAVALRATRAEIADLSRDAAVARIDYDAPIRLSGPGAEAGPTRPPPLFGRGDWGLAAIRAPDVWRDYGLDGSGVRVGVIDTGVDPAAPDLRGKVVAWRDFVNERPAPYDDEGHGTHVLGTMIGGSAGGAPIGVAPGARAVVAKALDQDGGAELSTLLAAAQWMTDPDGDPATPDYPTVINASWGAPEGPQSDALRPLIQRWRELGIVPVFAAGNSGPGGSIGLPAGYPEALAVGATGPGGRVTHFSSRGGALGAKQAGSPGEYGGSPALKPDLAAPGLEVLSAAAGGGYVSHAGTSMAAPHVAGAVALMRQADPHLSVEALEAILKRTARDVEPSGPDRGSGAGLLDTYAAVAALLGPTTPQPGLVVIAAPPAITKERSLTYAVASGGAPLAAWLDQERTPGVQAGPLLRVPVPGSGRHTIALAALGPDGAPLGPAQRFAVTVDRTPPALRLSIRSRGLLQIDYRARATDAVAGMSLKGLRSRTSDGGAARGPAAGQHAFSGPGPYWIELEARDRAGNVRRVRRAVAWPPGPVARRLAWTEAFERLGLPFLNAHLRRSVEGRYDSSRFLVDFLAANESYQRFATLRSLREWPGSGVVGVYSDGRRRLRLATRIGGRCYFIEDLDGRIGRGVSGWSSR